VEVPAAVQTVDAASACTVAVQAEGGDTTDDVRRPDEVRAARVTEAGAAGVRVVREQEREVADDPAVDLIELRVRDHPDAQRLVRGDPDLNVTGRRLGAVSRRDEDQRRDERAAAAPERLAGRGLRDHEADVWVAVAVEVAIGDRARGSGTDK